MIRPDAEMYSIPGLVEAPHLIAHNEGTSLHSGTSPSIGTGSTKDMRDHAIRGYTLGVNLGDPLKEPCLIERSKHHILAYDIEAEYMGPHASTFESPVLCVCLACSCGYRALISRVAVSNRHLKTVQWECFEARDNAQIAELTMELICRHGPIFTVGHNVYEFDNSRLACSLPPNSKFTSNAYANGRMINKRRCCDCQEFDDSTHEVVSTPAPIDRITVKEEKESLHLAIHRASAL
jgi:hypothetical protein